MGRPGSQGCRDWDGRSKEGPQVPFYLETIEIAGWRGLRLEVCLSRTFQMFPARPLQPLGPATYCTHCAGGIVSVLTSIPRARHCLPALCRLVSVFSPPLPLPTGQVGGIHDQARKIRTTRGHLFPRRKVEYGSTPSWTCLGLVWTILEGKGDTEQGGTS